MENNDELSFSIRWATKMAQDIVPDEIDLVPFITVDFMKGGKARKKLLGHTKGGVPGGFGAEGDILLPWIFHAISVATPFLGGLLASKTISSSLMIVKEIRAELNARKQKQQERRVKFDLTDPLVQQSAESLAKALQVSGLSPEKCEIFAYDILEFILKDPANAVIMLQKIMEHR